jgi:hypothetical protein
VFQSSFRHSSFAHAFLQAFTRLARTAKAADREGRVEREPGFGLGSRLFQFSEVRQRCGEEEMG